MDHDWADTLDELIRRVLAQPQPPQDLMTACVEHIERCDASDPESVNTAFDRMMVLAGHLWTAYGPDAIEAPVIAALNVALASYEAMRTAGYVMGLSKALHVRGLTGYSLVMLDNALQFIEPSTDAGGLSSVVLLQNHLGELLRQVGELDRAESAFATAMAALPAVEGASEEALHMRGTVLNNLGLLNEHRGDLAQARHFLVESLRIDDRVGDDPLSTAVTLDNLGMVEAGLAAAAGPLWLNGEYVNETVDRHLREAEEHLGRAAALFEAALPDSAEDFLLSLLNRLDVATQRGDTHEQDTLSLRAWELSRQLPVSEGNARHAAAARADVLHRLGRPEGAVELLVPWFEEVKTEPPHGRPAQGLTTLLRAAAETGDRTLAAQVGTALAETDDEMLTRRIAGASEAGARKMFAAYSDRTELILGHCLPPEDAGTAPEWLYELLLNRKGVLSERQGTAWLGARLAGRVSQTVLDGVRRLRADVARLDLDGSGEESITAARRRQAEAERRLGEAETQLYRELGQEQLPRMTLAAVRGGLEPDATLLDFTIARRPDGSRRYIVFLVRSQGAPRYRDLGRVEDVNRRLTQFTSTFAQPPGRGEIRDDWRATIRETAPALLEVGDAASHHLIVAPTGLWGMAPLGLLPDEHGAPLIDDHVITLVPSGRWLATRATSTITPALAPGTPLVIGDPDFDLQFAEQVSYFLSLRYRRLEHAGTEAAQVAGALGVEPALRQDATRAHLLAAHRPRILHIATHGVFLDAIGSRAEQNEPQAYTLENVAGAAVTAEGNDLGWPLASAAPNSAKELHESRVRWLQKIGPAAQLSRSALLLTGFNAWLAGVETPADVETGLISAGEFALLDLAATEMVVLSACETGVGAVDYADGSILGLRTAALAAGAACCVSTLWKVADASSAVLMSRFYQELATGKGSATALRAAQMAIRKSYPDPYHWAGWVVEGNGSSRIRLDRDGPAT